MLFDRNASPDYSQVEFNLYSLDGQPRYPFLAENVLQGSKPNQQHPLKQSTKLAHQTKIPVNESYDSIATRGDAYQLKRNPKAPSGLSARIHLLSFPEGRKNN